MKHSIPVADPDDDVAGPELFSALANADRLAMLAILSRVRAEGLGDQEMSIAGIAARVEISRFAASRHLAIMRRVGLVEARIVGRRTLHRLSATSFEKLEDWLNPFLEAGEVRWDPDQSHPEATIRGSTWR